MNLILYFWSQPSISKSFSLAISNLGLPLALQMDGNSNFKSSKSNTLYNELLSTYMEYGEGKRVWD
jgi:hypothetical protein